MQKIADDTEQKAAAERAAKEKLCRIVAAPKEVGSGTQELAAEQQEQAKRALSTAADIVITDSSQASRKKLEDMKCQTQALKCSQ